MAGVKACGCPVHPGNEPWHTRECWLNGGNGDRDNPHVQLASIEKAKAILLERGETPTEIHMTQATRDKVYAGLASLMPWTRDGRGNETLCGLKVVIV